MVVAHSSCSALLVALFFLLSTSCTNAFQQAAVVVVPSSSTFGRWIIPSTRVDRRRPPLFAFSDDAPSDYDSADLASEEKIAVVDENEEDVMIRDALKRELLLLASVTNRGEYTTGEERDIVIDLVTQLEALNPTPGPAYKCDGEWDLCLSSTQFFRSSPFFQAIRVAVGDDNKAIAENGFELHDRATSPSRVGRVRQIIDTEQNMLISEVDLEVAVAPAIPLQVKGTVVTTANLEVVSSDTWELRVEKTKVTGSNIPFLNELLEENIGFELPVGDVYSQLQGSVPVVPMKTFYVDEGIRISRDIDDNFFVFSRA